MGRVEGKVAIVTGGASGIGKASAGLLVREGARVVIADLNEVDGQKVADELGERAAFVRHDVTDESAWQSLIADTEARLGKLDVLVNNAGIVIVGTVEDTSLEDWRRIQAVNVEGVFLGCKHALPAMARAGGGSIINLSSVAALQGTPIFAAYSASKGAVRALTQTVAVHCRGAGNGVRCNSIHPGGIDTPLVRNLDFSTLADTPQVRAAPGLGEPEDIGNTVLYLASDESKLVNGAALVVDGGLTVG
jgi:3(or 17)beta-hydroxysteroid dehydrogenase